MRNAISYFPARPLMPDERALVAEWLASVGDIAATYVSSRRGDDPALYRRIVIVTKPDEGPSHLVHAPSGRDIWIVFSVGMRTRIRRFPTLRAALNSIRPVLADSVPIRAPAPSADVMAYIEQARQDGCATLQQIADALNNRGIASPRGRKWHPSGIRRTIERDRRQRERVSQPTS
jgi:hypothetical protein